MVGRQQHNKPIELWSNEVIDQKINYTHYNPVEAGFVENEWEYLYASARDHAGKKGLVKIIMVQSIARAQAWTHCGSVNREKLGKSGAGLIINVLVQTHFLDDLFFQVQTPSFLFLLLQFHSRHSSPKNVHHLDCIYKYWP